MSDDLMKRLHSLHKQATVERSHFYVGSCVKDAIHHIEELEAKLAKAGEVGQMTVTNLTENEDGGAAIEFDMDDTTAALAQELGLKLMIYCGATGTNIDYVFNSILGNED